LVNHISYVIAISGQSSDGRKRQFFDTSESLRPFVAASGRAGHFWCN
jgi:hypothetical protein